MPEYLAPGVYVEETTFRQKSIEGVSTSTAGFVGATRFGPTKGEPELLTSFLDFERIYGGIDQLVFNQVAQHNDLAHAVRGFFENGGRRLYVARTFEHSAEPSADEDASLQERFPDVGLFVINGTISDPEHRPAGAAPGCRTATSSSASRPSWGQTSSSPPQAAYPAPFAGTPSWPARLSRDPSRRSLRCTWSTRSSTRISSRRSRCWTRAPGPRGSRSSSRTGSNEVRVVTITVSVSPLGRFMDEHVWEGLNPDPRHRTNALTRTFAPDSPDRATTLYVPLVLEADGLSDGAAVIDALFSSLLATSPPPGDTVADAIENALLVAGGTARPPRIRCRLKGGGDGARPREADYQGEGSPTTTEKPGSSRSRTSTTSAIVAAPEASQSSGWTAPTAPTPTRSSTADRARRAHALPDRGDRRGERRPVGEARATARSFDSKHAALYYPWVTIARPVTRTEITMPPSGFVAGIYARNDIERGVYKAPANEVVRLAIGFELPLNKAQQDVLNPEGINCFRFFEGRGFRLWGARTMSSDPEWKYVNLRRYFAYLEHSIDRGTQWAVFEPNGERCGPTCGARSRTSCSTNGRRRPARRQAEKAFFVRCDRSTMTQNDLDNGRLVCLIGVAPLRPAEFVIFRIGQWTPDRKR